MISTHSLYQSIQVPPAQPLLRPPSGNVHTTSRPASPQVRGTLQVSAPAPPPVRARSPIPAVIPPYAPPKPPFPPPPPNTPIVSPKARTSAIFQAQIINKLNESSANGSERIPHGKEKQVSEHTNVPSAPFCTSPPISQTESGLATPPVTPPGVNTSKEIEKHDVRDLPPSSSVVDITSPQTQVSQNRAPETPVLIDVPVRKSKEDSTISLAKHEVLVSKDTPQPQVLLATPGEISAEPEQQVPKRTDINRSKSSQPQKPQTVPITSSEPIRKLKSLSYSDVVSLPRNSNSPYSVGVNQKKTEIKNASSPDIRETNTIRARPRSPQPPTAISVVSSTLANVIIKQTNGKANSVQLSPQGSEPIIRARTPQPRATSLPVHDVEKAQKGPVPPSQERIAPAENKIVTSKENLTAIRQSTPTLPSHSDSPSIVANDTVKEVRTPPLPSNWKETITRVTAVVDQKTGVDRSGSPQLTSSAKAHTGGESPATVLSDSWLQVGHETMVCSRCISQNCAS